jgi:hypothetical protein
VVMSRDDYGQSTCLDGSWRNDGAGSTRARGLRVKVLSVHAIKVQNRSV